MARRPTHAAAVVVLMLGLLAGCTAAAPEKSPAPSVSTADPTPQTPAPTPEPTPTVQPPQWTDAMDEVTVDGALAFGEYFMQLYPYVIATGDTTEWRAFSHEDCTFCTESALKAEADGFPPGIPRIELEVTNAEQIDSQHFALDYELSEWVGDEPEPTRYLLLLAVLRSDDQWLMRVVEVHEAESSDD